MRVAVCQPLFAWDELEHSSSLAALRETLAAIPDGPLLEALRQRRHHGCDKYPVSILWGVLLLSIVLRHVHREDCLAELRRNAGLRVLLGIDHEAHVPHGWNLSRFLDVLGQEPFLSLLRTCFDDQVQRLGLAVPDLGRHTAGDATHLSARRDDDAARLAAETAQGLPQASGGRKEYHDDDGKVTHMLEWFGYQVHLLVDVQHEVTLAYHVSDTKRGDNEGIEALVEQAEANLPTGRIETLAYDKAADDGQVHAMLQGHGLQPVIEMRNLWSNEEPTRGLGGHLPLHVVHNEQGTIFCTDTLSEPPVMRPMTYRGHEKDRETLKYRCPAKVEGLVCASEAKCNAGKTYGLTVRVPQSLDLRRFPSILRASQQFERLYKGRTAAERVHGRLKVFWGLDDGNVLGARRFHAHVGTVMVVHLAMATVLASSQRYEGTFGTLKLSPIAAQLRAAQKAKEASASG